MTLLTSSIFKFQMLSLTPPTATNINLSTSLCHLSVHQGCEQGSPPRLWCSDGRLSRSCSSENQHTSSLFGGGCVGGGGSDWPKKEAEENKENVRLDQCFSNTSGLPTDLDDWNESVISGGLKSLKIWFTVWSINILTHTFFVLALSCTCWFKMIQWPWG